MIDTTSNVRHLSEARGFVPCFVSNAEAAHARHAEATGVNAIHVEYAVADVLSDVDSFYEFLGESCYQKNSVDSERATRCPGQLVNELDNAVVLHALLKAADRNDESGMVDAARLLTQRYILSRDDKVQELAAGYAQECRA